MTYPHISGPKNISEMIRRLRNQFPKVVTSAVVKQYGIASNNESFVISALQFIKLIDRDGNKIAENAKALLHTKDEDFQREFGKLIRDAYDDVFDKLGENAWSADLDELSTYFRQTDESGEVIGRRKAKVFQTFAAICGKIDAEKLIAPVSSSKSAKRTAGAPRKQIAKKAKGDTNKSNSGGHARLENFGMSIKIDVNLPSDATKETYDNIFKSIRENLIDD